MNALLSEPAAVNACHFVSPAARTSFCSQAAVSMLKQDYKEGEMTLSSALALAIKVLNKTMDVSKLSAEKGAPARSRQICGRHFSTNESSQSDNGGGTVGARCPFLSEGFKGSGLDSKVLVSHRIIFKCNIKKII